MDQAIYAHCAKATNTSPTSCYVAPFSSISCNKPYFCHTHALKHTTLHSRFPTHQCAYLLVIFPKDAANAFPYRSQLHSRHAFDTMRNLHLISIFHCAFYECLRFHIARNACCSETVFVAGYWNCCTPAPPLHLRFILQSFVWRRLHRLFEQRPGLAAVSTFNPIKGVGILFTLNFQHITS